MAILTNKSDVISNFARYHGRQPNPNELKPWGLVDYLSTKSPREVEQLLAKDSPITWGLVWSEYNKQNTSAPSTPNTPNVPANPTVTEVGSPEGDEAAIRDKENLDKAYAYIESLWIDDSTKQLLRQIAGQQYTSDNSIFQPWKIDKIISDATLASKQSLDPHYTIDTARYIEDTKNKLSDIRASADSYIAKEKLSYSQALKNAKNSLMKSGRTFSSASRDLIWNQSALRSTDVAWIEWYMPEERRLNVGEAVRWFEEKGRDVWIQAERYLGSNQLSWLNAWSIANPYSQGREYWSWTSSLYNLKGWVTWDQVLDRKKAEIEATNARVKWLFY